MNDTYYRGILLFTCAWLICPVPALSVLRQWGHPAAAGQVLRTKLGKGKLAGARLRFAAPAWLLIGWLLSGSALLLRFGRGCCVGRTVCAAGTGSGSGSAGAKKTEDEPLLPASGGNCSRGKITRNRAAAAVTPPRQLRVREIPPPGAPVRGLSALDPVINIPVLDHRIGPVTGDNDMIENQYADPVQQALKLDR